MTTMRKTLSWMRDFQSLNPFHTYHPLRPLFFKYYKSKMNKYIGKVLDERFAVRDAKQPIKSKKKTAIDLALEQYSKENGQELDVADVTMDAEFRKAAIDNLLILLFAGHDTTASTLCYWYVFSYLCTLDMLTGVTIVTIFSRSTPPSSQKSAKRWT
jgi:hypothetical protein